MSESDKVWVTGLDGDPSASEVSPPPPPGAGSAGSGSGRRGMDWGLVLAVLVGVIVGVGVWSSFLRPGLGPKAQHYIVEPGDTLWQIARKHGVKVAALQGWNGLSTDKIEVGQDLLIYPAGTDRASAASGHSRAGRRRRGNGGGADLAALAGLGTDGPPPLQLPAAHPCLAGPDDAALGSDDLAFAASVGLSYSQTKASMDAFLPKLRRCVPDGGVDGTARLELTVGCDGRVSEVRIMDGGRLPIDMLGCVRDTLRFAAFPAHDMPDGFTFAYPLRFSSVGG